MSNGADEVRQLIEEALAAERKRIGAALREVVAGIRASWSATSIDDALADLADEIDPRSDP